MGNAPGWWMAYLEWLKESAFHPADDIEQAFRAGWMSCIANAPELPSEAPKAAEAAPPSSAGPSPDLRHAAKYILKGLHPDLSNEGSYIAFAEELARAVLAAPQGVEARPMKGGDA